MNADAVLVELAAIRAACAEIETLVTEPAPPRPGTAPSPATMGARVHSGLPTQDGFAAWEQLAGRPALWTTLMAGGHAPTPRGMRGASRANRDAMRAVPSQPTVIMSVPIAFGDVRPSTHGDGSTRPALELVASGTYDTDFRAVAELWADWPRVIWRLGHEHTGRHCVWSSVGASAEYVAAYRHVADVVRDVIPGAWTEWNAMAGLFDRATWEAAYPGDDYVDVVGLDFYDRGRDLTGPMVAVRDFAERHDKVVGFSEWGLFGADDPEFIRWSWEQFVACDDRLAYHCYFNVVNAKGTHALSAFPESAAEYRRLFGP